MAKAKKPATLAIVADLVNPTAHVFTSVGKVGLDPVDVPTDEAQACIDAGIAKLAGGEVETTPEDSSATT